MDSLEYSNVFKEDRGALSHGKFKVSPQAIYFKNSKTGKVENIKSEDIKEINWQRIALEYGIRISLKNGSFYRFGGFHDYDFDKLSKYCEGNYKIDLRQKDICLKGYNWGVANFNGSLLSFDQDKATCFEIPLTNVSHCASAKNEVTLEFHQNDDAPVSLMEIRFHIPTQQDSIVDDPVQAFINAVADKASIIQATGESICTFSELYCLTPRGRYDIKIFPTFIQLHGKTFDYKIPLTSILRLFRLPHKDQRQVFFVLSLDPPIKQGQTRYQFLILLFSNDEEITLDVTLTDELKDKYDGKIEERMSGYTVDVLGQVMKVLVQRKITQPGIQAANPAISCSYKAAAGYLYPLERGFMFVHKPPVHIRFDEITAINFARSGGSTRSFDFEVETKSSVTHTFSSIEKDEYSKLYDFVTSKNLRVKNRGTEKQKVDVDDDDLVDSDMEGEPDAYLQRVKNEGKLREQDDSEDDESEDEDFRPGEESDVEEEYDSDVKSSNGSSDEEADSGKDSDDSRKRKMKKQKHSKEKKHKKEKSSKKSSKKSKNDDDKPKKPMTAYFIWMNENRSSIKSKYPDLSVTEFSKKAGEIWKEKLSQEEKSIYEKKSEKAKEDYHKAMEEYNKRTGGTSKSSSSGDKSKKSAPKESKNESPKKFKSAEYIATSSESSSSDSD